MLEHKPMTSLRSAPMKVTCYASDGRNLNYEIRHDRDAA